MDEKLIMINNLKQYCNSQGNSVSKEFYEASNDKLKLLLDEACGRKTVFPKDL